jgi:hypothetical protein
VPYCRVEHSDRKDTTGTGPTVWGRSLAVMTIPLRPVMMAWPSSSWVVPCRRGQQNAAVWGVVALTDDSGSTNSSGRLLEAATASSHLRKREASECNGGPFYHTTPNGQFMAHL